MMHKKQIKKTGSVCLGLCTLSLMCLSLTGCSSSSMPPRLVNYVVPVPPKPSNYIDTKVLVSSLRQAGLSVHYTGQTVEVSGRRSQFFSGNHFKVRASKRSALGVLAKLMRQQKSHDAVIVVYGPSYSKSMASVTRKQASELMGVLWGHGIGASLLVAHGDDRAHQGTRASLAYPLSTYANKVVFRFKTERQDWSASS